MRELLKRHPRWDDRLDLLGHLLLRGPLSPLRARLCDWYDQRLKQMESEG